MVENSDATMVIFDNDLSPSQIRVLTELCGVQVLDRSGLILDIFAQRARTKEGCLQVELAQYQYLLPRLIGMWSHLERQGGTGGSPIGTKGPGETQLETDRRHIRRKIDKLKDKSEEVEKYGIEYATRQAVDLIQNEVSGLHIYSMNRSEPVRMILKELPMPKQQGS